MAEQINQSATENIIEGGENKGLLGTEQTQSEQPQTVTELNTAERRTVTAQDASNAQISSSGAAQSAQVEEPERVQPEITYEAFKLGDGLAQDDETMQSFTDFAKKHRLTQEEAQGLIDLQSGLAQKSAKVNSERYEAEIQKMTDAWEAQVKADPELGGADIGRKMSECRRVCERLGVPEAVEVLQTARMGSNPVILKLLYRASQSIKEDRYVTGSNANGANVSAAHALYPGMN